MTTKALTTTLAHAAPALLAELRAIVWHRQADWTSARDLLEAIERDVPDRAFTLAEIRDLLPEGQPVEILDGVLIVTPKPKPLHQRVLANLLVQLDRVAYDFIPDTDLHLGDESFAPDLSAWPRGTITDWTAYPTVPPTWACEVVSPSTRWLNDQRITRYAAAGVAWIWLVDPSARAVTVYEVTDGHPHIVLVVEAPTVLPPFDCTIDVPRLWP